jgi:RNA polymerase sigma-70 factor, ECF subfamily
MPVASGHCRESNSGMPEETRGGAEARDFEQAVLPHLDAAYNLARWLARNTHDAEDIVQEACLRAVKFFGGYRGGEARAWLLRIVRNTAYSFLEKRRPADLMEEFDEATHATDASKPDAEMTLEQSVDSGILKEALEELPVRFREVLILRELEGLSYKEIAEVAEIPIGTVMSSLARSRAQLRQGLLRRREGEVRRGLRK